MNYIILDMEWNQPFSSETVIKRPIRLNGEIIQIGAVKLNENFEYLDNYKINIRPKFYKKINRYVKKLTKISNSDLIEGKPFSEAFENFMRWCGNEFVFLTWGADDIPTLRDNLIIHNLDPETLPSVYNLQIIFCSQKLNIFRQVSLSEAMETVNEKMLEAHDALNDSMSTYEICRHLDLKKGIEEYEKNYMFMIGKKYETEVLGEVYGSKKEALMSENVISFECPECGERVFCSEAVAKTKGKSIALAKCKNGEEFFVKFRFLPKKGGKVTVCRSLKTLNQNNEALYYQKKILAEQANH